MRRGSSFGAALLLRRRRNQAKVQASAHQFTRARFGEAIRAPVSVMSQFDKRWVAGHFGVVGELALIVIYGPSPDARLIVVFGDGETVAAIYSASIGGGEEQPEP